MKRVIRSIAGRVVGRVMGAGICFVIVASGLWSIDNTSGWTSWAGALVSLVGIGMLYAWAITIDKDMQKWDKKA